ncbi:protein dispatched homolog 3 isoform X2 [Patella vulgata]|nr:protein dispatched homolog 3 isoform X2 [Patella vulgata]
MPCWPWNSRSNNGYQLVSTNESESSEVLDDNTMFTDEVIHSNPPSPCGCTCKFKGPSKCICVFVSVLVLCFMSGTSLFLGWYSWFGLPEQPVIDKSIDAFSIPNHEAYIKYDALSLAKQSASTRHKRSIKEDSPNEELSRQKRCFLDVQTVPRWKMHLIYLAKGDDDPNMFTKERLELVHQVEKKIVSHPRFGQFCLKDKSVARSDPAISANSGCAPLNSLLTYFFPTRDSGGRIHYDGLGSHIDDIHSALKFAMNHDTFYYFVDEKINRTYPKSRLIRTEVLFGSPLRGFDCFRQMGEQSELFKKFEITYIDFLSKASTSKVQVLYGGNEIFDYEIDSTFWRDIKMAAYSLASIIFIMFILTSFSPWLTILGIWSIMLSFPLAFFLYRIVFNINALGILNGAAAFVIIGIGVDDVFVFINIFHQTGDACIPTVAHKIKHTVITAGKATFFTSFTTAAAFAANMASSIPAVYEFGLFMSLIVSCCWLSVIIIMPPTLYLWQVLFNNCENKCYFCCINGGSNDSEGDSSQTSSLSDADVPMIQIDEREHGIATFTTVENNDDPMLAIDPVFSPMIIQAPIKTTRHRFNIGRYIQAFLNRCIAPVITSQKGKWIIIGFHVCTLITAIGLITQLHPASQPPQLFHPDTNIQQLLDLKANFSIIDNLRCDKCSAMYSEAKSRSSSGNSRTHDSHPATPRPFPHPYHQPQFQPTTTTTPSPITHLYHHHHQTSPPTTTTTTTTTTTQHPFKAQTRKPTTYHPFYRNLATTKRPSDKPHPVSGGFNSCKNNKCNDLKERPRLQLGTTVFVVFGIKGLQQTGKRSGHVINEKKGTVMYNEDLPRAFTTRGQDILKDLCRLCHLISNNRELVKNGSAQCIPAGLPSSLRQSIEAIKECRDLPHRAIVYNHQLPDHAVGGLTKYYKLKWLAFAFESTTSEGDAYFKAYEKYQAWDKFITHIKDHELSKNSPLKDIFQTSSFWKKVLMEVVAVYSAIYGLVLSLVICIIAVAIFTGHIFLLLIVVITIVCMICSVVGIFYLAGWEMGAIEAISLSILVGSSVDYCVHLVEGYILAGKYINLNGGLKNTELRRQRTKEALQHIGVAIISSAITTIIAAIPLTQTLIQPFSKFGDILLINTTVSILFTITLCATLLSAIAPAKFQASFKSTVKALILTCLSVGVILVTLFGISKTIHPIPGPNGNPLFP